MTAKSKLRSVRPTAKDEIAQLEADRDSWKREAIEAEQKIQEALKVLGYDPTFYDLVEAVKQIRMALGMDSDDKYKKCKAHIVAEERVNDASGIENAEEEKEVAEAEADDLRYRLSEVLDDRAALLKHTKLSEYEWYMLGGVRIDDRGT